jgi:hypothetical protein
MGYESTNVDCSEIKPYVTELILRCGSPEKASEYCGVGTSTLYRIRHSYHCSMQRATAKKIFESLLAKRREDRENKQISQELLKTKQEQAIREDRINRLSGY